jgi:hypothetical protein
MTVGTKGCIQTSSICGHPRMRSNAVGGGGDCTLSLAWEGAVMMPLQAEVERDRWDRTKRPVFHPGAPCSLSPQLQMPIFTVG